MTALHFWRRARVPVILQTEATECGLACLAMVAGYHGYQTDLASLRRQFSISLKGSNLQQLIEIGIKLSAPVMVAIFFSNLAIAIVGKAVPQINVLVTSLSVNIAVGFIVMIVSLPLVMMQMESFLEITTVKVFEFLKSF